MLRPAELAGVDVLDLGDAGLLLVSPRIVGDVLRSLEGAVRAQRAAGVPIPERVTSLVYALRGRLHDARAAAECRTRQSAAAAADAAAEWEPAAEPLTVGEAAAVLGIGERRTRDLIAAGQLAAVKVGGRHHIDAASVVALAQERQGAA